MAVPFEIQIDPARGVLRMTARGQWRDADFDAFADAYREAVTTLNAAGGILYSLVDARDYQQLTPDLAERFPALIAESAMAPTRRTAFVMPALMNRVRTREVGEMLNARYFRTVADATDWLFGKEA